MVKNRRLLLLTGLFLIGTLVVVFTQSASAGALQQSQPTSTPNAQGQIIYVVQEGDTCTRIFLLTGIPIEQLIALNNLGEDCNVFPSQELILALVEPTTATPIGPTQTPTMGPPTPTPFDGNAEVCIVLYEDLDGNQKRSENEFYLGGGVISISNRIGTFSETKETPGGDPELVDPVCFEDVPEGEYNLSMGVPEGFNPTTSMNFALTVTAGDTIVVDFGAQPGSQAPADEAPADGAGRSPLLLAIGLFFLAGGAALAFFFIRARQGS